MLPLLDNLSHHTDLCSLPSGLPLADQEHWARDPIRLDTLSAYLLLLHQCDFVISYYQDGDGGRRTPLFNAAWLQHILPMLDLGANFDLQVRLWQHGAGWASGSNYAPTVRDTLARHPAKPLLPPEMQSATSLAAREAQHTTDGMAVCWQVVYSSGGVPVSCEREYPGWMLLLDHHSRRQAQPN